jgi:hypothetical protein
VIFGDLVKAADTAASAEWIARARRGSFGTVGSLVPNEYASFVRVHAPPPIPEDWWSTYCDLYEAVAEVGARHTSQPERAWFAVWEGHGFDTATSQVAWWEPPADEAERRVREAHRARVRDEGRRRNTAIRAELAVVPRFAVPDRTYYLMEGPVAAVVGLRDPSSGQWRNPDLFWPDDRRWFVATDVDFWSLFVGGDHDFITELTRSVLTPTEIVALAYQLESED